LDSNFGYPSDRNCPQYEQGIEKHQCQQKLYGHFELSEEKCHSFLFATPFCMNESLPCNL
jgi:hypothetical protein